MGYAFFYFLIQVFKSNAINIIMYEISELRSENSIKESVKPHRH